MSTFKESLVKMHSAALASGAAVPPDVETLISGIDDFDKRMVALPEESRAKILGSTCFGIVGEPLTLEEQAFADEFAPLWKWSVAQIAEIPDEFHPR